MEVSTDGFEWRWAIDKSILYRQPLSWHFSIERIMDGVNEVEGKGIIIQGHSIHDLKFADDVDLLDKDADILQ